MWDLDGVLEVAGLVFLALIITVLATLLLHVELVLTSTFEGGLVEVDSEHSYVCTPTDRTKKITEAKRLKEGK